MANNKNKRRPHTKLTPPRNYRFRLFEFCPCAAANPVFIFGFDTLARKTARRNNADSATIEMIEFKQCYRKSGKRVLYNGCRTFLVPRETSVFFVTARNPNKNAARFILEPRVTALSPELVFTAFNLNLTVSWTISRAYVNRKKQLIKFFLIFLPSGGCHAPGPPGAATGNERRSLQDLESTELSAGYFGNTKVCHLPFFPFRIFVATKLARFAIKKKKP